MFTNYNEFSIINNKEHFSIFNIFTYLIKGNDVGDYLYFFERLLII